MSTQKLESKIVSINNIQEEDSHTDNYREWETFMFRVHSAARSQKNNKMMAVVGECKRNRHVGILDGQNIALFANKNSIGYTR